MRTLKLIISAGYLGLRSVADWVGRRFGRPDPARVVFLYYHEVSAEQRVGFARQMDALLKAAVPIPADARGPWTPGRNFAAVTFDDGFQCVVDNAVPELVDRRIPVAIFVPSHVLGLPAPWEGAEHSGHHIMDETTLRNLPSLVTIGSHSRHHPRMTELDRDAARVEFVESRARLEAILGRPVTLFAFPYGAHNEELLTGCAEAGYERAFSVVPSAMREDSILVGRVSVYPDDGPFEFALKVRGGYDWLPAASRWKRRLTARTGESWVRFPARHGP